MLRSCLFCLPLVLGCSASPDQGDPNASGGASSGGVSSTAGAGGSSANGGASVAGTSSTGGNASGGTSSVGGAGASSTGGSATNTGGSTGTAGSGGDWTPGGSSGDPGAWQNVTPAGISTDFNSPTNNFGVMDVVGDPVRLSDLYAFVCYQGVWRSTDFGATWTKVNTGANGSVLETGRPWTAAIDNDKNRNADLAPALYTANGYGAQLGVWKSTDWGVSWTKYFAGQDIYSLEMDPYDNQHLITGFHEGTGVAESTDGGETWDTIAADAGISIYPHFIDTGSADTTRKTWFLVPQVDSGSSKLTTNGGDSFSAVGGISHPHGGNQFLNVGDGTGYVAGSGGVHRTTDSGATWNSLYSQGGYSWANGVLGTPTTLYAWDDGASGGGIGGPHLFSAPREAGTPWTAMANPPAMNNGAKAAAVTFDGTHHIIVSGNWTTGIWRYVEP